MAKRIEIKKTNQAAKGALSLFFITLLLLISSSACSSIFPNSSSNDAKTFNTINWLKNNYQTYQNPSLNSYLANLILRLELSALKQYKNLEKTNWRVHIINSDNPNAFSAGSGNIVMTKNLLLNSQNESSLAAIIAHEMSHHYLSHKDSNEKSEIEADLLAVNIIEVAGFRADATINALNILYRLKEEKVSNSIDSRRTNLLKALENKTIWGIGDSREYRRVMRRVR